MREPQPARDDIPFRLLSDQEFRALSPDDQIEYLKRALKLHDDIEAQLHRLANGRIPKEQ